MALLIERLVKQIGAYAETLHQEVETMAKAHKAELARVAEETKYRKRAMVDARQFTISLTQFGKAEEVCDP